MSRTKNLIQVGLIYRGPFDSRPHDTVGIGASKLQVSDRYTRNTQMLNAANGVTALDDPLYVPEQRREYSYAYKRQNG
nr:carbohydrate porin [Pseudomonas canadensis]